MAVCALHVNMRVQVNMRVMLLFMYTYTFSSYVNVPHSLNLDPLGWLCNVNIYEMDDSEDGVVLMADLTPEEAQTYQAYLKEDE